MLLLVYEKCINILYVEHLVPSLSMTLLLKMVLVTYKIFLLFFYLYKDERSEHYNTGMTNGFLIINIQITKYNCLT